jgi:hypothetical protein
MSTEAILQEQIKRLKDALATDEDAPTEVAMTYEV